MTEEAKTRTAEQQAVDKNHPANPAAPATPDLTVSDLQALKTIIDVAQSRGSFKAAEMAVVANTYNRLMQFLDAVKPAQPEGTQTPAPAKGDATAEAVTGVPSN